METERVQPQPQATCTNCGRAVHPGVGCSGFAPPEHARYKPGQSGNPGGWPKGLKDAADARRALALHLAANPDESGIGALARQLAEEIVEKARLGEKDTVNSIATVLDQALGKPKETVAHEGFQQAPTIILESRPPTEPR